MGGANSLKKHVGVKQKGLETLVYQRLDVPGAVGKDEVGSSNLPSSSRNAPKSCDFEAFLFCFPPIVCGSKLGSNG